VKFERESWRKLYIAESGEHRLMSIFARGLRDYLLRLAGEDGTILAKTKSPKSDLQILLGARSSAEKTMVNNAFDELVGVGYLSINGDRLWITRFKEAQEARSPGAVRQAKYKAKRDTIESQATVLVEASNTENVVTHSESSPVASSVTLVRPSPGDASVTSQIDETRRDETRTPNPAAVVSVKTLATRATLVLENPHDGQWQSPSKWPETIAVCEAWSFGMVIKLRDFPPSDSDLRTILEAFRDGYTVAELVEAGRRAKTSEYFRKIKRPGPSSFTAAVIRRLLADEPEPANDGGTMQLPPGVKFGAEGL